MTSTRRCRRGPTRTSRCAALQARFSLPVMCACINMCSKSVSKLGAALISTGCSLDVLDCLCLPPVPDAAQETLQVLTVAHTYCVANGGDVDYDGGCALAKTYASSYAEACAEAFVASFIDFAYGKKDSCHCDIGVSVLLGSITHEIAIISAFYETEVEARSCTPDVSGTPDYAYIKQECWAKSMADMVARVRLPPLKWLVDVSTRDASASASGNEHCTCQHGALQLHLNA